MPIAEEDFKRLPPEVQAATLEREKRERIAAAEYAARLLTRAKITASLAASGAIIISILEMPSPAFYPFIGLAAAAAGWFTAQWRYQVFGGILLIGGVCLAVNLMGIAMGLTGPLFFVWVFYLGLGALVGAWADGRSKAEDAGF